MSEWLRARRPEIEGVALARVYGVSDPAAMRDPEYVAGLRAAVSAALDYGLAGIEHGEEGAGPPPALLLAQARHAARSGVSLGTVLRRYIAGHALLGDFITQASEQGGFLLEPADSRRIQRAQAALLDRLVTAVDTAYVQEVEGRLRSTEERRVERVKKLLEGHLLEPDELQYEFDAWHIGAVATGSGAQAVLRDLAAKLDRRLLLARPGGGVVWAWLGGRSRVSTKEAEQHAPLPWPSEVSIAIGEPERGVAGWRLTHRQAKAAIPVASRPRPRLVRYAEVALLAAALHDDVLASSLQRLYLDPLSYELDGGAALRQTLNAYFASGRNASSAAAALGLSRQTVNSRLRVIETRIDRQLIACASEMDTALRLFELSQPRVLVAAGELT